MRYYFHTETDRRSIDTEGMEFPSDERARAEAIQMCGQMMHKAPESFWISRPWNVTITDKAGLVLWIIELDAKSFR